MASELKIKVNGLVRSVTASLDTPLDGKESPWPGRSCEAGRYLERHASCC